MVSKTLKATVLTATFIFILSSLNMSIMACDTLLGDVNHDKIVNAEDASLMAVAWQSIIGDANFNPDCDFNHDEIINIADATFIGLNWMRLSKTHVMIFPHTLNLKSQGKWITCIILLPKGVNSSDVDVSSIRLNGTIAVSTNAPIDRFLDGLMVKFSRKAVIELIHENVDLSLARCCTKVCHVTLTVNGCLVSGPRFVGSDVIRVIHCK